MNETPPIAVEGPSDPKDLTQYVGFFTRVVGYLFDVIAINVVALLIWSLVYLLLPAIGVDKHPHLSAFLMTTGIWALVLSSLYFIIFWSVTGQTPGARLMGFRVVRNGSFEPLGFWRALARMVGMIVSTGIVGIGFLPVIVTNRRRGLHDWCGGSVARWNRPEWAERNWRARRRARADRPDVEASR